MFNPLLPDISKLKNEDLENKITELMKKYLIAARSGNGGLCEQISVTIDHFKQEQSRRHQEAFKKTIKNSNLDDFINVND